MTPSDSQTHKIVRSLKSSLTATCLPMPEPSLLIMANSDLFSAWIFQNDRELTSSKEIPFLFWVKILLSTNSTYWSYFCVLVAHRTGRSSHPIRTWQPFKYLNISLVFFWGLISRLCTPSSFNKLDEIRGLCFMHPFISSIQHAKDNK